MERFIGKTAIVTGGGRGIGEGVARIFAAEGANVLIATRTLSRGDKVAKAIRKAGGQAEAIATDVASAASNATSSALTCRRTSLSRRSSKNAIRPASDGRSPLCARATSSMPARTCSSSACPDVESHTSARRSLTS